MMNRRDDREEEARLNRIATVYGSDALAGPNEQYHLFLRDALIPLEGGRTALEIGCGKGLWTAVLGDRYEQLDVVDASNELLTGIAQSYGGRARLTTHTSLAEHFLAQGVTRFQHVYLTFLLEHVDEPVALLQLVRRRCEKEGTLFVAVPNADSIHRELAVRAGMIVATTTLSENDQRVGHRRVYTLSLLRDQLAEAGFEIHEEKAVGFKPLTLTQLEALPASVIAALCASGDLVPAHPAYWAVVATCRE